MVSRPRQANASSTSFAKCAQAASDACPSIHGKGDWSPWRQRFASRDRDVTLARASAQVCCGVRNGRGPR
jgi:hypothetical protein